MMMVPTSLDVERFSLEIPLDVIAGEIALVVIQVDH
jgi:hypothetical protein